MPKNKSIIPSTCMISTPVQDERERKREREGGDRGRERETYHSTITGIFSSTVSFGLVSIGK